MALGFVPATNRTRRPHSLGAVRSNWPGMALATPQSTAVADAEETIVCALSEAPKPIRPVGGA